MLLCSGILDALIAPLKVFDAFGSSLFSWDPSTSSFQPKSSKHFKSFKYGLAIGYLYTALAAAQVGWYWKESGAPARLTATLFTGLNLLMMYICNLFYRKGDEAVSLMNAMLDFERRRNRSGWYPADYKCLATKWILKILGVAIPMIAILFEMGVWINPCMPMNLGFFLLGGSQCGGGGGGRDPQEETSATLIKSSTSTRQEVVLLLLKLGIVAISACYLTIFMFTSMVLISVGLCVKPYCIASYIRLCRRNPVSPTTFKDAQLKVYREIQVMSAQYRWIYSNHMTVACLLATLMIQIISFGSALKLRSALPVSMTLFFVVGGLTCMSDVLIFYGNLGAVHKEAKLLLGKQSGDMRLLADGWARRSIRATQLVKVYLGGVNYVEQATPIVCESFMLQQTISLALLLQESAG